MDLRLEPKLILFLFCACGGVNVLFYVLTGPSPKGKQFFVTPVRYRVEDEDTGQEKRLQSDNTEVSFSPEKADSNLRANFEDFRRDIPGRNLKNAKPEFGQENGGGIHDSGFILNEPDTCKMNSSLTLITIVFSDVINVYRRQTIRDTWASFDLDQNRTYKTIFLVGKSNDTDINVQIKKESDLYRDIVQTDIIDSYRNLTLKSILMLKWIKTFCVNVTFSLKVDDDVFAYIPNIVRTLVKQRVEMHDNKFIMGYVFEGAKPIQDPSSKWFTPKEDFAEEYYPRYCSGTSYALTTNVVPLLYHSSLKIKPFWLEDIYITGLCARDAHVKRIHNPQFWFLKRSKSACEYREGLTGHDVTTAQMHKLFSEIMDGFVKC